MVVFDAVTQSQRAARDFQLAQARGMDTLFISMRIYRTFLDIAIESAANGHPIAVSLYRVLQELANNPIVVALGYQEPYPDHVLLP